MNEFVDPVLGRMVAMREVGGCSGCAYDHRPCPDVVGIGSHCSRDVRDDGRGIIWVRAASAPHAPKVVRLRDEQILAALPDCHGSSLGRSWLLSAARDIERAVLRANNLESQELATDHREQDDVSQWDGAQALDDSDNLIAMEQRAERAASRAVLAVLAFIATAAAALICAAAII